MTTGNEQSATANVPLQPLTAGTPGTAIPAGIPQTQSQAGSGVPVARARRVLSLSAGGMPGMDTLCGALLGLADFGITEFDLICGASAGSMVGGLLATGRPIHTLEAVLRGLTDSNVRSERFAWQARLFWIRYFMANDRIKRLLNDLLPASFSALKIPLEVNVTLDQTGLGITLNDDSAPLPLAVMASAAIAGVFPPVSLPGRSGQYSDGGTTNYCARPLLPLGPTDELWMLIATPPYAYTPTNESVLSRLMMNVHLLIEDQITDTIEAMRALYGNRVHVIRPTCGASAGTLHFDHTLIDQARKETGQILRAAPAQPSTGAV